MNAPKRNLFILAFIFLWSGSAMGSLVPSYRFTLNTWTPAEPNWDCWWPLLMVFSIVFGLYALERFGLTIMLATAFFDLAVPPFTSISVFPT
jgi:hypothetical protein